MQGWTELMRQQDGVITRAQLLARGCAPHDIKRLLRRRQLVPIRRGIFVDHTGTPTRRQSEWSAVLLHAPAALSHQSALDREGAGRGPVHVAVDRTRRVARHSGIVVHYTTDLQERAMWNLSPPRIRLEEAVLDVAASARQEMEVIAVLADSVGARRTTPDRLATALDQRARFPRRGFVAGVIEDVAAGTCSVLEHCFLTDVARCHQLPRGQRQVREVAGAQVVYRDFLLPELDVAIELDGVLHHSSIIQKERDLDRDIDAAVNGLLTVRLGWGQVVHRPCRTAQQLAALLRAQGWQGQAQRCPRCP